MEKAEAKNGEFLTEEDLLKSFLVEEEPKNEENFEAFTEEDILKQFEENNEPENSNSKTSEPVFTEEDLLNQIPEKNENENKPKKKKKKKKEKWKGKKKRDYKEKVKNNNRRKQKDVKKEENGKKEDKIDKQKRRKSKKGKKSPNQSKKAAAPPKKTENDDEIKIVFVDNEVKELAKPPVQQRTKTWKAPKYWESNWKNFDINEFEGIGKQYDFNYMKYKEKSILEWIIESGNSEILKQVIGVAKTLGINLSRNSYKGNQGSPLHFAAKLGKLKMIDLLVCAGANVLSLNADGNLPIHIASENGHGRCVEYLLSTIHKTKESENEFSQTPEDIWPNGLERLNYFDIKYDTIVGTKSTSLPKTHSFQSIVYFSQNQNKADGNRFFFLLKKKSQEKVLNKCKILIRNTTGNEEFEVHLLKFKKKTFLAAINKSDNIEKYFTTVSGNPVYLSTIRKGLEDEDQKIKFDTTSRNLEFEVEISKNGSNGNNGNKGGTNNGDERNGGNEKKEKKKFKFQLCSKFAFSQSFGWLKYFDDLEKDGKERFDTRSSCAREYSEGCHNILKKDEILKYLKEDKHSFSKDLKKGFKTKEIRDNIFFIHVGESFENAEKLVEEMNDQTGTEEFALFDCLKTKFLYDSYLKLAGLKDKKFALFKKYEPFFVNKDQKKLIQQYFDFRSIIEASKELEEEYQLDEKYLKLGNEFHLMMWIFFDHHKKIIPDNFQEKIDLLIEKIKK